MGGGRGRAKSLATPGLFQQAQLLELTRLLGVELQKLLFAITHS